MPGLDGDDLERVAELLADRLLGNRRAIKVAEQRVNLKPRRPAGYTYAYLEALIGTGLSGTDWDVAFTLAARANTHGLIVYSAAEVAGTLGLSPTQLHRSVRACRDAGLWEKIERSALRLNPRMLWRGSSATQVRLLSEQIAAGLRAGWDAEGTLLE